MNDWLLLLLIMAAYALALAVLYPRLFPRWTAVAWKWIERKMRRNR